MSAISIVTSLALMTGAAFAAFTSTATNNSNTFGAGTLVLNINNSLGSTSNALFDLPSLIPGTSSPVQEMNLENTGTIPMSSVMITGLIVDNSTLASHLTLTLFNDHNGDGVQNTGDSTLASAVLTDPSWTNFTLPSLTIPANGEVHVGASVAFDNTTDNTLQGQTTHLNINLQGNQ